MEKKIKELFYRYISAYLKEYRISKSTLSGIRRFPNKSVIEIGFRQNTNVLKCGYFNPIFRVGNENILKLRAGINEMYRMFENMNQFYGLIIVHPIDICSRFNRLELDWVAKWDDKEENLLHMVCDENSMERYLGFYSKFMDELGHKFINSFESYQGFDIWFNYPFYNRNYKFKIDEIENMAIYGIISAWLNLNQDYENILEFWLSMNLPTYDKYLNGKTYHIDIKTELRDLDKYLKTNYPL